MLVYLEWQVLACQECSLGRGVGGADTTQPCSLFPRWHREGLEGSLLGLQTRGGEWGCWEKGRVPPLGDVGTSSKGLGLTPPPRRCWYPTPGGQGLCCSAFLTWVGYGLL